MEPSQVSGVLSAKAHNQIQQKTSIFKKYLTLENNPLSDILSSRLHSNDFTQKRTDFIRSRLWIMCMFFAFSVPLFAFFDFFNLPIEHAQRLLSGRLSLSASLLMLAFLVKKCSSVLLIRYVIAFAFLLPSIFFLFVMYTFEQAVDVPLIFGMMPYMIIAMVGLFPLTIRGGVILITLIFLPFFIYQLSGFNGDYWLFFNAMWLFLLFSGISLWLQAAQLSMLMHLYRESTIDPLTKLINRRVLMRSIRQLEIRNSSFSVIMFDLDRFKRINDIYGHLMGDKVLRIAAKIIRDELNSTDIVARYGGEEFMAVLPNIKVKQAIQTAERIAKVLRETPITLDSGDIIYVTSSIGVTIRKSSEAIEAIFKRVDDLLYHAKEQGRDRVISDG
ncbi:MAG: GGDEF domain-containing protein [Alteromonadales bacterium]|nr:GGDEF domain-containing protein [Alteromonadales bacterium]